MALADSDGSAGLRLAQVLIVTSDIHYINNNIMITYPLRMRWVLIMRCDWPRAIENAHAYLDPNFAHLAIIPPPSWTADASTM